MLLYKCVLYSFKLFPFQVGLQLWKVSDKAAIVLPLPAAGSLERGLSLKVKSTIRFHEWYYHEGSSTYLNMLQLHHFSKTTHNFFSQNFQYAFHFMLMFQFFLL